MRRVVLDTNVLMSAAINPQGTPAQILAAWRTGRFVLLVSAAILEEVDRVLQYPKVAKFHQWPEERRRLFVEDLAHLARRTSGVRQISAVAADPTDNRYLECAVEGEAEFLVTGDQHLLSLGSYEGIQIVTPARFWQLLSSASEALLARVRIRQAAEADAPRLLAFYQESGYAGEVTPTDVVLLAEEENRIIGALRLCEEHGTLVLRGMRVHEERQRQGIGTRLLQVANEQIGERTCYCLPHPPLEALYGRIGFVKVRPEEVPPFLLARWTEYRDRGVDTLLMKKFSPVGGIG